MASISARWSRASARARDELDAALAPLLDRKPAELDPIEHAVLLIGGYELQHRPEVPFRVVINEAVGLARRFGATDGHKFVNGVLDRAARLWRADERAAERAVRSVSESELIERYFRGRWARTRDDVVLGIGDDAALLRVPRGPRAGADHRCAGRGGAFPARRTAALARASRAGGQSERYRGHGRQPELGAAVAEPAARRGAWLREFCARLRRAGARACGGAGRRQPQPRPAVDHGAARGLVPAGQALRRDGARAGDELYVSGSARAMPLRARAQRRAGGARRARGRGALICEQRFEYPEPARGARAGAARPRQRLHRRVRRPVCRCHAPARSLATAARRSRSSACRCRGRCGGRSVPSAPCALALTGGEDYELCFTAAGRRRAATRGATALRSASA